MNTFNKDDTAQAQAETGDRDALVLAVRVLGLCLFLVGLWAAVHTLYEAFTLYRDPGRVAQFASYIEQGLGAAEPVAAALRRPARQPQRLLPGRPCSTAAARS